MTYFSNAGAHLARVSPGDLPGSIGITTDLGLPGEIVGIAYANGHGEGRGERASLARE